MYITIYIFIYIYIDIQINKYIIETVYKETFSEGDQDEWLFDRVI